MQLDTTTVLNPRTDRKNIKTTSELDSALFLLWFDKNYDQNQNSHRTFKM